MKIISHRGWWHSADEKNTVPAFERTLTSGFGSETDVRDRDGQLVVSHDPARSDAMPWKQLLDLFEATGLVLAVNVKADGLATLLKAAFEDRDIAWFAFDMSGPETVRYANEALPFYTRHSEIESVPVLYDRACGVWLDAFYSEWWERDVVLRHVDAGKSVCVVSPELHGREPRYCWEMLMGLPGDITLCTDNPDQAFRVFAQ